jgi:hypothetical protein
MANIRNCTCLTSASWVVGHVFFLRENIDLFRHKRFDSQVFYLIKMLSLLCRI